MTTRYLLEIVPAPIAGPCFVDLQGMPDEDARKAAIFATATAAVVFALGLAYPTEWKPVGRNVAARALHNQTKKEPTT